MKSIDKMSPLEALIAVAEWTFLFDTCGREPGAFIKKMPKAIREQLEKLTSDDARKVRIDWLK